jgi:hypothetical protein
MRGIRKMFIHSINFRICALGRARERACAMVVKLAALAKPSTCISTISLSRYLANPEVACAHPLCSPKHVFVCWQTGIRE